MWFYAAPFQLKFYAVSLSPRWIVYANEQCRSRSLLIVTKIICFECFFILFQLICWFPKLYPINSLTTHSPGACPECWSDREMMKRTMYIWGQIGERDWKKLFMFWRNNLCQGMNGSKKSITTFAYVYPIVHTGIKRKRQRFSLLIYRNSTKHPFSQVHLGISVSHCCRVFSSFFWFHSNCYMICIHLYIWIHFRTIFFFESN